MPSASSARMSLPSPRRRMDDSLPRGLIPVGLIPVDTPVIVPPHRGQHIALPVAYAKPQRHAAGQRVGSASETRIVGAERHFHHVQNAVVNLKRGDRKSTRLNSSHLGISYAV